MNNDDQTATFITRNGGSTSHMKDLMTTYLSRQRERNSNEVETFTGSVHVCTVTVSTIEGEVEHIY